MRRATVVADRAMFSEKNLQFMDESGFEYVVAAKLRALPKDLREDILGSGLNRFHLKRRKEKRTERTTETRQKTTKEKREGCRESGREGRKQSFGPEKSQRPETGRSLVAQKSGKRRKRQRTFDRASDEENKKQ